MRRRQSLICGPAGLAVAALAIHQAAWLLSRFYDRCHQHCDFSVDLAKWPPTGDRPLLFCWEAFVSGLAHSDTHVYDAATAATAFLANESQLATANAVTAERPISLIGAVALWSRWVTEADSLRFDAGNQAQRAIPRASRAGLARIPCGVRASFRVAGDHDGAAYGRCRGDGK